MIEKCFFRQSNFFVFEKYNHCGMIQLTNSSTHSHSSSQNC